MQKRAAVLRAEEAALTSQRYVSFNDLRIDSGRISANQRQRLLDELFRPELAHPSIEQDLAQPRDRDGGGDAEQTRGRPADVRDGDGHRRIDKYAFGH